ncbi:MAG TPA: hypothetical protein PKE24_07600 [Thauera aminoaromatica]|nr:hypothetical protein [Thauera aminoaromatica]
MALEPISWYSEVLNALEAFGGWAAVVAVLLHYLSDLHAKRALQQEASELSRKVADLAHELKLRESAYTKHLELLIRYYEAFYRHYRICQGATNQDAHRFPDGSLVKTRDTFWEKLDDWRSELAALEGSARLLLPSSLLDIHEQSIAAFNEFKDVMTRTVYDDKYQSDKRDAFAKVENVKLRLEAGLRSFLRTEHMVSASEA